MCVYPSMCDIYMDTILLYTYVVPLTHTSHTQIYADLRESHPYTKNVSVCLHKHFFFKFSCRLSFFDY